MSDQQNGSAAGVGDVEERLVSVAYPQTLDEFRKFFEQGYQCATTAEQRAAWGLEPVEDVEVLTREQALRVLFAEPGDPILDELDEESYPDPYWALGEDNAPDAAAMKRIAGRIAAREGRLDATVTVRDPRRPAAGSGDAPAGGVREVAAAPA